MPTQAVGRESRRSSKSGPSGIDAQRSLDRREKAKSSQSYVAPYTGTRRGSVQPNQDGGLEKLAERPRMKTRTNSAPLVVAARKGSVVSTLQSQEQDVEEPEETDAAELALQTTGGAMAEGQDEDEVAGVVGAVRQYQPFQSAEVSEPLQQINIAVIGAEGVGKSTFVQKALDLPHLPPSQVVERKIPIDGTVYLVRLLELPMDDVDIDDDDKVSWPDTIEHNVMPSVDGALTLYDVNDKDSLEHVPEMLSAIKKADLPSLLISCKCDTPASERQVDPTNIEQKARRSISNLNTFQTSGLSTGNQRQAISMILRAIIFGSAERKAQVSLDTRQRAQSNAVRPVSPRPPSTPGHTRASSEYSLGIRKDQPKHGRHDSSIAAYASTDRLKVPRETSLEAMSKSFLLEESPSESTESTRSSADVPYLANNAVVPTLMLSENGATFEELVDRLLAQPMSKADTKFCAIFLALYRKFAAPGRLLEAIITRFDALERTGLPEMLKTVTQLRYLSNLEQWVGTYPGDFAYNKTRRQMWAFVNKITKVKIFAVAAKEMMDHLSLVQEDDDTNWACTDRDHDTLQDNRVSASSNASTITDVSQLVPDDMSGTTIGDNGIVTAVVSAEASRSSSSSTASSLLNFVSAAQKAAQGLQPVPRQSLTKVQWRAFMDMSDEVVAKELTRMDWIMFSSIRPRDLVRHVQLSATEKAACRNLVNVKRMEEHFNQISSWVVNYVLLRDKPKHRALMLEKFMRVARKLRELNNYNSLGAVIAGVKNSSVHRLVLTKDLIPPDVGRDWLKLEILMSPTKSYTAYRLAWDNSSAERIPYLPLHRRDLVSANEGNKTYMGNEKDGRVNWNKFNVMGEIIVGLQRAQGMPYRGLGAGRGGEGSFRELVLDVRLERDEEILYARSLQCEPAAGQGGTSQKFKQFFQR